MAPLAGKRIALTGSPGAGKTTLTNKLAQHYNATPLYEEPVGGFPPHIQEWLKTGTNLFQKTVWFRNRLLSVDDESRELASKGQGVIIDVPFYHVRPFVDIQITDPAQKDILSALCERDFKEYSCADCTVYIRTTPQTARDFLERRKGYFAFEHKEYMDFIAMMPPYVDRFMDSIKARIPNLITIDRLDYDFEKQSDLERLTGQIERSLL